MARAHLKKVKLIYFLIENNNTIAKRHFEQEMQNTLDNFYLNKNVYKILLKTIENVLKYLYKLETSLNVMKLPEIILIKDVSSY